MGLTKKHLSTRTSGHALVQQTVEVVVRGFRHSAGLYARVILDGAACRLGEHGAARSGVVVEGRVNEEDDVLVVRGR